MIPPDLMTSIVDELSDRDLDETVVFSLRETYPDVHFTYCCDDDIVSGQPVVERPHFNVYLVDGSDHCLQLTGDCERATGLVLAYRVGDDDQF
ncbi:MAG: hypothetical protein JXR29_12485 [Methylothermaceae bacterium]|nr:hypothetical protein [Methylothermaceae bacterium]